MWNWIRKDGRSKISDIIFYFKELEKVELIKSQVKKAGVAGTVMPLPWDPVNMRPHLAKRLCRCG